MIQIVAAARVTNAPGSLQTALVALGSGLLFFFVGLIFVTNYRGLAHWWIGSADHSPEDIPVISGPLRRANIRIFGGDETRFAHYKLNIMPKIVGSAFMVVGFVSLVAGIVKLFLLA